tara:strand:- start:800 stop:1006 length:207 start_codon:yes stop_codon:yes gene_type:complete
MTTFRDKHFKNELDPKAAYYECLRSCEIRPNSDSISSENQKCAPECIRILASNQGYQYLKALYLRKKD